MQNTTDWYWFFSLTIKCSNHTSANPDLLSAVKCMSEHNECSWMVINYTSPCSTIQHFCLQGLLGLVRQTYPSRIWKSFELFIHLKSLVLTRTLLRFHTKAWRTFLVDYFWKYLEWVLHLIYERRVWSCWKECSVNYTAFQVSCM